MRHFWKVRIQRSFRLHFERKRVCFRYCTLYCVQRWLKLEILKRISKRVFIKIGVMFGQSIGLIHTNLEKLLATNRALSKATRACWASSFKSGDPTIEDEKHGASKDEQRLSERMSGMTLVFKLNYLIAINLQDLNIQKNINFTWMVNKIKLIA